MISAVGELNLSEQKKDGASSLDDRKELYILVADRDLNNQFFMSMLLRRFDYNIRPSATGGEALKIAKAAIPSLVITGTDLKDMSGIELMQQIKTYPGTTDVPFIAVLMKDDFLAEKRCIEAGMADCLSKPVSAEDLYRAVQAAVETVPRTNIRIKTHLTVTVDSKPLVCLEDACMSVLSEGGIFIPTKHPRAINTRLPLQIHLHEQIIDIEAEVVYSYRTNEGPNHKPGMGLRFVRIASKDAQQLRVFVKSEVMRGFYPLNDVQ